MPSSTSGGHTQRSYWQSALEGLLSKKSFKMDSYSRSRSEPGTSRRYQVGSLV